MSNILNKLTEKDFTKHGPDTPILGEIYKVLKDTSSAKLIELCKNLINLYTGEQLRTQFSNYIHFISEIEKDLKIINDKNTPEEDKKLKKEHYEYAKLQSQRELEKLMDLIKMNVDSKVPLGAYSEKISDSEIHTKNVRGLRQIEDLSATLLFIFSKHSETIDDILWMNVNDPRIYHIKPLRVLFDTGNIDDDSLFNFLRAETPTVEAIGVGEKTLRTGLIELYQKLPFFNVKYEGSKVYLEMGIDIINIFYKTNLKVLSQKESEARDEVANQLIQIFTSDLANVSTEKHFHKQLAIILSFILKNMVLKDGKTVKLDVERVYILEDEECEGIKNIANILFLPEILGHHGNVKVSNADVKNTLKLYFSLRRAKLFGLKNIRLKIDNGRITTTLIEEPTVNSLLYKTQMIVQDALRAEIFREHFRKSLATW